MFNQYFLKNVSPIGSSQSIPDLEIPWNKSFNFAVNGCGNPTGLYKEAREFYV